MKTAFLLCAATASLSLASAEKESLAGLKPGDFVQVNYRWRNVDVPPTATTCPYVTAQDANGKTIFRRLITNRGRRGFLPDDCDVERWQVNFLVEGGMKTPPGEPESAYTRIPSNAVAITAHLSNKGDAAERTDIEISISRKELKPRGRKYRPDLDWEGSELSDEELDAALAVRERAKAEVYSDGDRTALRMNGKPFTPCIYKSTHFRSPWKHRISAAFTNNGFNVFYVPVKIGGYDTPEKDAIWRQDGTIDFGKIRAELRNYLRWNPDAYLILEAIFQPPRGWGEAHPSELYRNENGEYAYWNHHRIRAFGKTPAPADPKSRQSPTPSYASEAFAKEMGGVLSRICAELESSPEGKAVIGVFFGGGTDEQWLDQFDNGVKPWQMGDYSDIARKRFKEFLREKYGTAEKLNRAYGRSDISSFEEMEVPSTEELASEKVAFFRTHGATPQSDYREFLAKVAADMWLTVAKCVKDASGRRLLFGGYSPHGGLSGYPLFAQSASKRLMESPDMDFFAVVPGYMREFCDPIRSAVFDGTMVRHGKLTIRELDLRSRDSNQFWGRWKEPFWQEVHSSGTFRRKSMHYAADAIVHGGTYHAYDMDGGWFNSQSDQASWKAVNEMARASRSMPPHGERIALVGSESYCRFYSSQQGRGLAYPLLEYVPKALQFSGVPWNAYLLEDLLEDESIRLPKVVLLSEGAAMTADGFERFRSRYARDGRVIVYFWRPGLFSQDGDAVDRHLGLKAADNGISGKQISCVGKTSDPLTDALSGIFATCHSDNVTPEIATASGNGWKHLLFFDGTGIPGVSVRRGADCTEVYISLPGAITSQFCRNLAKEAGFRPLVESDELCGCGSGIFYMVAQRSGMKRFRLPKGCRPEKVLAGNEFNRLPGDEYSVTMKSGDIFALSYLIK